MSRKEHWEGVYQNKPSDDVSWYQKKPSISLGLIESARLASEDKIIDVGGGASVLVDFLIEDGFRNITVLDLSSKALSIAKERLGEGSKAVNWVVSDITEYTPKEKYRLWHDRAVFHFLTEQGDRKKYRAQLEEHVEAGGIVIISSFSIGGPKKCSGLDTVQYDSDKIQTEIGPKFSLIGEHSESHITPGGKEQSFNYFMFKKIEYSAKKYLEVSL